MAEVRILEHPSDVGLRAEGRTFAEALDQAVLGLARIQTGDRVPAPEGERVVELEADDEPALVVSLLEECLYLVDAEDWLASRAQVEPLGEERWRAHLAGAPVRRDEDGVHVKAITWHQLAVEHGEDAVAVTVYVDI